MNIFTLATIYEHIHEHVYADNKFVNMLINIFMLRIIL